MTRIYVVTESIQRNEREDTDEWPCIVVRHDDGRTEYTNEARILGPASVRYSRQPMFDGARVWVETEAPVIS